MSGRDASEWHKFGHVPPGRPRDPRDPRNAREHVLDAWSAMASAPKRAKQVHDSSAPQVSDMTDEMEKLKRENRTLLEKNNDAENKCRDLTDKCGLLGRELESISRKLKAKTEECQYKVNTLTKERLVKDDKIKVLESEVKNLKETIKEVNKDLDDEEASKMKLKEECKKLEAKNASLERQVSALNAEMQAYKRDTNLNQIRSQRDSLVKVVKTMQSERIENNDRYANKCDELRQKDNELTSLDIKYNNMAEDLLKEKRKVLRLEKEAKKQNNKVKAASNAEVVALRKQVSYYKIHNEKNKRKLLATERSHAAHEKLLASNPTSMATAAINYGNNVFNSLKQDFLNSMQKRKKEFQENIAIDGVKEQTLHNIETSNLVKQCSNRIMENQNDNRVMCSDCDKSFQDTGNLQQHITKVHGEHLASVLRERPIEEVTLDDD